MNNQTILFATIVGIVSLTIYLIATSPTPSPQEREEMEEEWWG